MKKILTVLLLMLTVSIVQAQDVNEIFKGADMSNPDAIKKHLDNYMYNLSYEEFEAMALKGVPEAKYSTRAKSKQEYNAHHKNDGRAVKIYLKDYKTYLGGSEYAAIAQIGNAKTYAECRSLMKVFSPNVSEEDIKQMWEGLQEERKRENASQNTQNRTETQYYKQKKNKKDTTRLAINTSGGNANANNSGDGFDLGDLFGEGVEGGNTNANGEGGFNLGDVLDVMQSDEAAELAKKAEGINFDEMDAGISELESKLDSREKILKMSGLTDKEAKATDIYIEANDNPDASVAQRLKKGEEYFRAIGVTDERVVDLGVAMTVNRDHKKKAKTSTTNKDKEKKKPIDLDKEIYNGFTVAELAISYVEPLLKERYGMSVPRDLSQRQLNELTLEYGRELTRIKNTGKRMKDVDTDRVLDKVFEKYLSSL